MIGAHKHAEHQRSTIALVRWPDSSIWHKLIMADSRPVLTLNRHSQLYPVFHFVYKHTKYGLLNMSHKSATFENSYPPFCKIWIIFTYMDVVDRVSETQFQVGENSS